MLKKWKALCLSALIAGFLLSAGFGILFRTENTRRRYLARNTHRFSLATFSSQAKAEDFPAAPLAVGTRFNVKETIFIPAGQSAEMKTTTSTKCELAFSRAVSNNVEISPETEILVAQSRPVGFRITKRPSSIAHDVHSTESALAKATALATSIRYNVDAVSKMMGVVSGFGGSSPYPSFNADNVGYAEYLVKVGKASIPLAVIHCATYHGMRGREPSWKVYRVPSVSALSNGPVQVSAPAPIRP